MFIRTVNKYGDIKDTAAGAPTVIGGSARMSVEGTPLIEGPEGDTNRHSLIEGLFTEVEVEKNKCGCTNFFVKILIGVFVFLTILFVGVGIGVANSNSSAAGFMVTFATIFLVVSVILCNILCCACCQYPKGADE
ncbi:hypothetical protein EON65_19340 [archaeon]|nr:MAG: hypothetical protein EON65_19340 [archaeon]